LLRYKYYSEYCFDLENEDICDDDDEDDEEQDSRLLARKIARHYPLSEIDADIWQACNNMESDKMESDTEPNVWCNVCQQAIPVDKSLQHELQCVLPIQAPVKSNNGLYCNYCDIQFVSVNEYMQHDAHCIGYDWHATLEEGLYYKNEEYVHPMDLEFEVGAMEWV